MSVSSSNSMHCSWTFQRGGIFLSISPYLKITFFSSVLILLIPPSMLCAVHSVVVVDLTSLLRKMLTFWDRQIKKSLFFTFHDIVLKMKIKVFDEEHWFNNKVSTNNNKSWNQNKVTDKSTAPCSFSTSYINLAMWVTQ